MSGGRYCPDCDERTLPITLSRAHGTVRIRCPVCRTTDTIPQPRPFAIESASGRGA